MIGEKRASNLGLARKAAISTDVGFDEVVFQGGLAGYLCDCRSSSGWAEPKG